jgi:hypothetical protein
MADWVTISSLATAGGTLVLAAATFGSVRSANRASRVAERSLQIGLRPVLVPSRPEDPPEQVGFVDTLFTVQGGTALVEKRDDNFYLAIPLRNVGAGLAVLIGWNLAAGRATATKPHADPDDMRLTQRDLYVPAGDTGYWQGGIRAADDPYREVVRHAVEAREGMTLEVLYGDHEGGQLTITRFGITPQEDGSWLPAVGRHWLLDRES